MSAPAIKELRVSPRAVARSVTVSSILGDVRVEGWIVVDDQAGGLEACRLLGGLFGLPGIGGFSLDGQFLDFPFSFDVRPGVVPRTIRLEGREELLARVVRDLRQAPRRLARQRDEAARKLEAGAFNYAEVA